MNTNRLCFAAVIFLIATQLPAQLNIEWQQCFDLTGVQNQMKIYETADGGFIGSFQVIENLEDFLIYKLSADGQVEWDWTYPDFDSLPKKCYSIIPVDAGGYLAAGTVEKPGQIRPDILLIKLTDDGFIEWTRDYGGSQQDIPSEIRQLPGGDFIMAAYSASDDGNVTGFSDGSDYWMVRLNSSGDIIWEKSFGGTGEDQALDLELTANNEIIVAGTSYSNDGHVTGNHGLSDIWVIKLTEEGELAWQKSLGGIFFEELPNIAITQDDEYLVSSTTYSLSDVMITCDGNQTMENGWLAKLSTEGELEWTKCLGGNDSDFTWTVETTSEEGFLVAGHTESSATGDVGLSNGGSDAWLIKLDSLGQIEWHLLIGGTRGDEFHYLKLTNDGGLIASGSTNSTDGDVTCENEDSHAWVVKFSTNVSTSSQPDAVELGLYPNPASNVLYYTSNRLFENVELINPAGKVVSTFGNNNQLNVERLPRGPYLLKFIGKEGIQFRKVLLQ